MFFLNGTSQIELSNSNMATVYVVVENGELYKDMYSTYDSARKAVTTKYAKELREEWEEAKEMNDPDLASDIPDENKDKTGTTYLYIEKGIHIIIQRYNVPK
jgi:hypothetical protein